MKCNKCGAELMLGEMKSTDCLCDACRRGDPVIYTEGWQVCPKCQGQGKVWFPPDMPWNQTYATNGQPFECDVCKGKKIIGTLTGLPPKD